MPVPKLCSLCENILMQNYQQLKDLGDTRYELIKKVLGRFNAQQLMELEMINPKLILDDEETWFNLVKREFPQDIHERFTTNVSKIKNFFKLKLDEVGFSYDSINLDNYIQIQQFGDSNTRKYKLPSKLLYLKYTEDYLRKEELAIENLRQRMKAIQKDKEQNGVVHIDDVVEVGVKKPRPTLRKPERSKIFMKSQNEAKHRTTLFKNPLGRENRVEKPIRAPRSSMNRVSIPKQSPAQTKPTNLTSQIRPNPVTGPVNIKSPSSAFMKPASPIRRTTSSIFHPSRLKPKMATMKPNTAPVPNEPVVSNEPVSNEAIEPPKKKININEYKARKQ